MKKAWRILAVVAPFLLVFGWASMQFGAWGFFMMKRQAWDVSAQLEDRVTVKKLEDWADANFFRAGQWDKETWNMRPQRIPRSCPVAIESASDSNCLVLLFSDDDTIELVYITSMRSTIFIKRDPSVSAYFDLGVKISERTSFSGF